VNQSESKSKVVSASVSAEGCPEVRHVLNGMRTVSNLDIPLQSIDEQTLKERQHLRTVSVLSYKGVKAQIIIGLDKLGWAVNGRQASGNDTSVSMLHICHCTTVYGTRKLDEYEDVLLFGVLRHEHSYKPVEI